MSLAFAASSSESLCVPEQVYTLEVPGRYLGGGVPTLNEL